MIDKPFYIIIAAYCFSFGFLGAQFLADSYGIVMTAPDGTIIRNAVTDIIQIGHINTMSTQVNATVSNFSGITLDPILNAAAIAWSLFQLMTGVYVFNILTLFGIPAVFIIPITVVYYIFLARTLIALIRGI